MGSIPGSGRSPGVGNGNPNQYSCLENPRDRGAWLATVHGVAKSLTQLKQLSMHQFSSVTQSCLTLWNPMNCSTPGIPVHHQLPGFTETHVHWVGDAIQPSHPLSFPFSSHLQSFPASGSFPMSQLFASGGWSIGI